MPYPLPHPIARAAALALAALPPLLPLHAAAQQADTIEVVGRTMTDSYQARDAAGAKTDLPLRELPQSVRVITRQAIDDLGATRFDQVLDHVAGLSRQNNLGGLWDNLAIRGLPGHEDTGTTMLLNGFTGSRGYNAPRDLAGIERIEFLKGSAAALYGSSEPGGTLNIVSKRPKWTAANTVEAQAGSYGFKRGTLDSTGPLGERFAYRFNLAAEDRDSFRDHVHGKRHVVAPAFTWRLGTDTQLDYVGEVLHHVSTMDRGVIAVNGKLGVVPRSRFLGEPSDGDMTVDNSTHQAILTHHWNDRWTSRVGLSYRETELSGYSTQASVVQPAAGLLTRQRRYLDFSSDDIAMQAELQGTLRTGAIEHELLVGVETFRFRLDSFARRASPTATAPNAIDYENPVYGQPKPAMRVHTDRLERQRNTALTLQDAIKLGPEWRVVAGLRMDRYRQSLDDAVASSSTRQDPSSTSPRLGVSWLPTPQWTVYASAGRSFRPNAGADAAGRGFAPEKGRAYELGAKWQSADGRLGATAAVYEITKRNVLTSDPDPLVSTSIAAGEMRSRGVELELSGELSQHWRVIGSLAYNDAEVTKDNRLAVGGRVLNIPRITGSVLAVYEGTLSNGQAYGIGGGVTHVGKRLGQPLVAGATPFELPAYTTARLSAHWQWSPALRFTLDVDNLFDRTYYASSYNSVWVAPGAARTLTAGLQARF